jgi:hypothetical protein
MNLIHLDERLQQRMVRRFAAPVLSRPMVLHSISLFLGTSASSLGPIGNSYFYGQDETRMTGAANCAAARVMSQERRDV